MKTTHKITGWKIGALLLSALLASQPSWPAEIQAFNFTAPSQALVQKTLSFTAHRFALNAKEQRFLKVAKLP